MPTPAAWQDPEYLARLRRYSEPARHIDHARCAPVSLCEWPQHYWNEEPDSLIGRAVLFARTQGRGRVDD